MDISPSLGNSVPFDRRVAGYGLRDDGDSAAPRATAKIRTDTQRSLIRDRLAFLRRAPDDADSASENGWLGNFAAGAGKRDSDFPLKFNRNTSGAHK